ncbi:TolC family outer membrane protein [Pseudomonas schmalbachii]|uniref:TolC family outer membrane protein n=1 Tax=Pseudomonas schmalbachii TaxID=2816993 RepID=A0ABS3TQE8_9PSED|nr:TolC family outer membrane protein [Pseudomonas schmalbachii]MBO3275890.1 TolC family outer membrane protein [Pseudomonas schmalbachii]
MARGCVLACLAGVALPVGAMDLKEAWDLLQYQGPIYQSAVHEKEAGQEYRTLGKAPLLPQINATAYDNEVNGTQEQGNIDNDLDYGSYGTALRLRQTVFDKRKMAEYRQGDHRTEYSNAVFDSKRQEAAISLAGRYFNVLLARESIELAKAKLKAFEEQYDLAARSQQLGEGTLTDVDDAIARRDLAQAELIEAEDNLLVARRLLQEYLGVLPESLSSLHEDFHTPPLQPDNLQDWLVRAKVDNPAIRASRYSVSVAEEEAKKARAGHWPTLDFVAGYTYGKSETISTIDQKNRYGSVGLELNIPIYSGGAVSAQSRQAVANRDKAEEDLNASREEVLSGTTREFHGVQSGAARIRALETAVRSSQKSIESSRKGFQAGTRTNVDILNAEEQYYTARRDLFEAKLRYLVSRLRLAASVGSLGDDDIALANGYLTAEREVRP